MVKGVDWAWVRHVGQFVHKLINVSGCGFIWCESVAHYLKDILFEGENKSTPRWEDWKPSSIFCFEWTLWITEKCCASHLTSRKWLEWFDLSHRELHKDLGHLLDFMQLRQYTVCRYYSMYARTMPPFVGDLQRLTMYTHIQTHKHSWIYKHVCI